MDADLSYTSKIINQVIEKGILYEHVDGKMLRLYGRLIKERTLFFNPEVAISGNKNSIDLGICAMLWTADHIEKAGIKLPLKIGLTPDCKHGRLYTRDTWQKTKRKKIQAMPF